MSLPRYPNYKDSGVEWLGEVPGHWEVCALKRIVNMQSGESITGESIEETGEYQVFGGNGLRGYTSSFTHDGKFVLIGRQGALCGNINYASGKFWASEHAVVATPIQKVNHIWLGEMLRAMNLNQYSVAAAQPGLSVDLVGRLGIGLPPLPEQAQIAAFLDRETAKIDELVAEQRRLMELLKEKRQAVISHAVTRGLNPDAPLKPSGIEWLGDVPEHWEVGALGYLATVRSGSTPDRSNPAFWGGDIPWIKTGEIDYLPICQAEEFITTAGLNGSSTKMSEPGTMLMAMYGQGVTRGRVAILEVASAYNQACAAISFGNKIDAKFAQNFFVAAYHFIRDTGNETSQMNLSTGIIQKFQLTIPPISEQIEINSFLDKEVAVIDTLTTEAQRAIDLLQERRTALISAAVTGQIDVRGAVAA